MAGTHSYSTTGIVARGGIYVAGDNKVYKFNVPGGTPTPTPTATATASQRLQHCNCDGDCKFHSNIYTNGHRDWHANIDPNCHATPPRLRRQLDPNCHRKCESDTDTQTNAHSETPYDTEAAPESAAKAVGRRIIGSARDRTCCFRRRAETNFPSAFRRLVLIRA